MPVAEAIIDAALEYDYERSVALFRRLQRESWPDHSLSHSRQIATFSTPTTIQGRYGKTRGVGFFGSGGFAGADVEISMHLEIFPPPVGSQTKITTGSIAP